MDFRCRTSTHIIQICPHPHMTSCAKSVTILHIHTHISRHNHTQTPRPTQRYAWKLTYVVLKRASHKKNDKLTNSKMPTGSNQPKCQILFHKKSPSHDFIGKTLAAASNCDKIHTNFFYCPFEVFRVREHCIILCMQ